MDRLIVLPWESPWWLELVACAEKGGSTAAEIIDLVQCQHAFGLAMTPDHLLLISCAEDDALVVWVAVGRRARQWVGMAEAALRGIAAQLGCRSLRIEDGRRGWQRLLPHWTVNGENLEIYL